MIRECLVGFLEISRRRRCGTNQLLPNRAARIIWVTTRTEIENARGPLERTFLKLLCSLPERGLPLLAHTPKRASEMPLDSRNNSRDR